MLMNNFYVVLGEIMQGDVFDLILVEIGRKITASN